MTTTAPPKRSSRPEDKNSEATKSKRRSRRNAGGRRKSRQASRPTAPVTLRNAPFAGLVTVLLAAGLVTLLMINNSLAAGSFEQAELRADRTLLFEQEQALNQEVLALSSPTRLRAAAQALGMVPAASPAYVDPATGEIKGVPMTAGVVDESADPTAAGTSSVDSGTQDWSNGQGQTPSDESQSPQDWQNPQPPAGEWTPEGTSGTDQGTGTDDGDSSEPAAQTPSDGGAGDGASLSSGTAYDRAIVSGTDLGGEAG